MGVKKHGYRMIFMTSIFGMTIPRCFGSVLRGKFRTRRDRDG